MTLIRLVQESPSRDDCPLCGVSLGKPRHATRRQIVLTRRPGLFCWRCPDCRGTWAVRSVRHAEDEDLPAPADGLHTPAGGEQRADEPVARPAASPRGPDSR